MLKSSPIIENWTRVIIHLPNLTLDQRQAFERVVEYVQGLKDSGSRVTGFTQIDQVTGQWWDKDHTPEGKWVTDTITLLVIDFMGSPTTDAVLLRRIARIRAFAFACYRSYDPKREGQDEIWMMMHPEGRFV